MKSLNRVLMVLAVVMCVVAAQAQTNVMLKGNVPFNFVASDHSLPAGEYTVATLGGESEAWYNENGRALFITRTVPLGKEADAQTYKLVFHRYGDTYILTEVWSNGISHLVSGGKAAQQIAKSGKYQVVAVLMTR